MGFYDEDQGWDGVNRVQWRQFGSGLYIAVGGDIDGGKFADKMVNFRALENDAVDMHIDACGSGGCIW